MSVSARAVALQGLGFGALLVAVQGFRPQVQASSVITGSGSVTQPVDVVLGSGFCGPRAVASSGGANFSRGTRTPLQFVGDVRRERLLDALGLRLTGTGVVEQPVAVVSGAARIKRISLVATSASVETGAGEVLATAEFRDIELEMVALLLAA